MNKILTVLCVLALNFNAFSAENYPNVKKYVDNLISEVSTVVDSKQLDQGQKVEKSKKMISDNLDLEWMAKFTLGRNKKNLTPEQIKIFVQTYTAYVIKTYSDLVKNYKGEKGEVLGLQKLDQNEYIVKLNIISSSGSHPLKVEYLVRENLNNSKNSLKVGDVVTEGISMINSQQAEFNNIILNKGFDALLMELKKDPKYTKILLGCVTANLSPS